MKQYDAVLFDLDGTLLDTLQDLADSTNYALTCSGMPRRSLEEVRQFVGSGIAQLIHLAVPAGTPSEQEGQCLSIFQAHYLINMEHKTAPYPGVLPILEALREQGVLVGVVSNKFDDGVKGLCRNYFGGLLPVAIGEHPGFRKKPAPDLVEECIRALGGTLEGTVYVGDSDVDILTAQNAGVPCISVSWGFRSREFLLEHGASLVVDRPEELLHYLIRNRE